MHFGVPVYFVPRFHFLSMAEINSRDHESYEPIRAFVIAGIAPPTPVMDDVLANGTLNEGMLTLRVHESGAGIHTLSDNDVYWDPNLCWGCVETADGVNHDPGNFDGTASHIYWAKAVNATNDPGWGIYSVAVSHGGKSRCLTVEIGPGTSSVRSLDLDAPGYTDPLSISVRADPSASTLQLGWVDRCLASYTVHKSTNSRFTDEYTEQVYTGEWADPAPLDDGQTYFYRIDP
jgi:hypothetical protein